MINYYQRFEFGQRELVFFRDIFEVPPRPHVCSLSMPHRS